MDEDDTILPRARSAGHDWRERFHATLDQRGLSPEAMADALLAKLPEDPVGVFRAVAATLPKEVDVRSETQTNHLVLMQLVGRAQERGLDLSSLLTSDLTPEVSDETMTELGEAVVAEGDPDWLR